MSAWDRAEAERAFGIASRARRRARLVCSLRGGGHPCGRLAVAGAPASQTPPAGPGRGVREIPLTAITATVEPARAAQFDREFRPAPAARARWLRVWVAEHRGAVLPPVSVVPAGDGYAIRDGHHRVSVARARGATTIDANVAG